MKNRFTFSIITARIFIVLCLLVSLLYKANAQQPKHRIAVFSPIYIDSAFKGDTYKLYGNYLPKNMLPGLEFYNGVMMAIDSLKSDSTSNLLVDIYDYKSKDNSLNEIIDDSANGLNSAKVIIASFNNRPDIKILADYAKQHQIPLISATYPNDGGISNNPYFFLLNPTLRTHCKAIYQHLQKHHSTSNVIYLTRKGGFEAMVENYFAAYDSASKNNALNLEPITLVDTFYSQELSSLLDSSTNNVIVCGTINEAFAKRVLNAVSPFKKYKITVVGMPTWEGLKSLERQDYKGIEIIYTSPYNYSKNNKLVASLNAKYRAKYNAKPSDLVYKGYETMLRFGKTVSLYGAGAVELFGDDLFKVINALDIQPVYNKDKKTQIDFYENNRIYFLNKIDGTAK